MNRQEAAQQPRPRTDLLTDLAWTADAACMFKDEEKGAPVFFPIGHQEAGGVHPATEAKAICGGCPVRDECLDYALAKPERYGVWGGLTERERERLRKRRAR